MGRAPKPRQRFNKLYIGQWLSRLNRRAGEVAAKSGVDEAYLSQLISGEKTNPGTAMMMAISEELGISVNALYREPPPIDITESLKAIRPDLLEALSQILPAHTKRR